MPPKKMPPPPKRGNGAKQNPEPESAPQDAKRFAVVAGRKEGPQRIVIYGPGGIGKSTLAALAPGAVFLDLEGGTGELDVPRVEGIDSFSALRACLQSDVLDGYSTVIVDSATKAEEMALEHTLHTVPHEKGHYVTSIEGYGFGKGYMHLYDTFLRLLQDLDGQIRKGRNVVLIAHECVENVPNPTGDDFIRYEPHLQSPRSGKASVRNRVVQWADHVLFIGYDVVSEDGKGKGVGTRTIWPVERPDHIAKSRSLSDPMDFDGPEDDSVWGYLFGKEE